MKVDKFNVMIKIFVMIEGFEVIMVMIVVGISVNVILIFSFDCY